MRPKSACRARAAQSAAHGPGGPRNDPLPAQRTPPPGISVVQWEPTYKRRPMMVWRVANNLALWPGACRPPISGTSRRGARALDFQVESSDTHAHSSAGLPSLRLHSMPAGRAEPHVRPGQQVAAHGLRRRCALLGRSRTTRQARRSRGSKKTAKSGGEVAVSSGGGRAATRDSLETFGIWSRHGMGAAHAHDGCGQWSGATRRNAPAPNRTTDRRTHRVRSRSGWSATHYAPGLARARWSSSSMIIIDRRRPASSGRWAGRPWAGVRACQLDRLRRNGASPAAQLTRPARLVRECEAGPVGSGRHGDVELDQSRVARQPAPDSLS
jgi:hypothetical protein